MKIQKLPLNKNQKAQNKNKTNEKLIFFFSKENSTKPCNLLSLESKTNEKKRLEKKSRAKSHEPLLFGCILIMKNKELDDGYDSDCPTYLYPPNPSHYATNSGESRFFIERVLCIYVEDGDDSQYYNVIYPTEIRAIEVIHTHCELVRMRFVFLFFSSLSS